ncbi:MAG TPA: mechanosensitive ion channel family protein [Acidimicrobiales bacterium]|nr:mechanosensitive ion channel family protein [Acidimicrobiales bacterium]
MADHGYLYNLLLKMGLSDFAASTGEFLLVRPLKILVIVLAGMIVSRVGSRAIRRSLLAVHRRTPLRGASPRAEQRATTVADALAGAFRWMVWIVVVLIVLDEVGVNLAPLLAGAGIAGLAIGFGAQSLVKDVITGLFVLAEDQYGVGDTITLGTVMGTVEDMSLRVTRLRAVDGTVWFVPNGEVKQVGNASKEWARAIVDVSVPTWVDPTRLRTLLAEEATAIAADPAWSVDVLEAPEVWGATSVAHDNVTQRLVVKVTPARQAALTRELRSRINARLHADGLRNQGAA